MAKKIFVFVEDEGGAYLPILSPEHMDGIMPCYKCRKQKRVVFKMADPDYVFVGASWDYESNLGGNYSGHYANGVAPKPNGKKVVIDFGTAPTQNVVFSIVVNRDPNTDPDPTDPPEIQADFPQAPFHPGHGGGRLRY
ncbi:MAG: hypothetical protein RIB43_14755 [Rhodospirillaceae bacterium]